jgi:competence protein ComEC
MRSAVVGFCVGVCLLQIQAALLDLAWLIIAMVLGGILLLVANGYNFGVSLPWRPARLIDKRTAAVLPLILKFVAAAIIGFCWAGVVAQHTLSQSLESSLEGQDIEVVGVIDSLPAVLDQGVRFNFRVEAATQDQQPVSIPSHLSLGWYAGQFRAAPQTVIQVEPGERWHLTVRLQRPHGNANANGFDYEVWLLEQNLRATGQVQVSRSTADSNRLLRKFVPGLTTVVERTRGVIRRRILDALVDQPYAGAIVALVIGDQRAIPQSDWKVFNRTGIGHLVSISGLHITMIAGLFAAITHFFWRRSFYTNLQLPLRLPAQKCAALVAAVIAFLYVLLAGFGIPAQRTLYMLWVVAAALWCGRINNVSQILCIAAMVVLVLDPWAVLWPGFWLSFGAVAIILYASVGRLQLPSADLPKGTRLLRQLKDASHTQYVVTLGLVPLTILLFGQVSLISPFANAIAIPLISLLVAPLALAGSVLPTVLAVPILKSAHALFAWLADLLTWLSSFSAAVWSSPLPAFWMFICAFIGTLWMLAPRGWTARWLGVIGWLPILINVPQTPQSGDMQVTAFDIGQGMALLIETAQHRLLYDTGPFYSPESNGANRVILPYLKARGIEKLDGIIISHSDNDHSGGALSLFEDMNIGWVASSLPIESPIVKAAPNARRCLAGEHWQWDGIDFEMLHPKTENYDSVKSKPNSLSCTLKITRGSASMLLPGDIEKAQERGLLEEMPGKLSSTILLAPHHGSGTSSTVDFLNTVQPKVAIFQVGYRNRYHHPKPQIYERYGELGIERIRTDDAGAISLQFSDELTMSRYRVTHARYWYGR